MRRHTPRYRLLTDESRWYHSCCNEAREDTPPAPHRPDWRLREDTRVYSPSRSQLFLVSDRNVTSVKDSKEVCPAVAAA
ncbi:hypothetical protein O3P69_010226 [Scylla paramamosain]|uniref:Uncharacterized protein n=1 Tax=Scylla paramamosain TaxID=85552 RepID=A0AAW0TTN4_SCYPA